MFGPFSAGDSLRLYRLQRKGISLDLQRSLTQPYTPLREAWLAFVTQQAMGQPTYVLSDLYDGEGFVQVRYRPHQAAADVAFLAPALKEGQQVHRVWSCLLDGACVEAAGHGIQRVFANLPESGEVDVFQQAGFMPYTGEDIFRFDSAPAAQQQAGTLALRPQCPEDWPAIQKLCVAVTPQRIRQAEGGIAITTGGESNCQRYVLSAENSDDLQAELSILTGGQAYWLRMLMHPEAGNVADGLIRWALSALASHPALPIYCSVRQYEGGVRAGLEAAGFVLYTTRVLMVKHTLAWSKIPVQELAPALSSSAEAVPPAYRINGDPELQPSNNWLATTREP